MKEDPAPGTKCRDKFLVQSVIITPERESTPLPDLWKQLEDAERARTDGGASEIHEQKIRCAYLPAAESDVAHSPIPEEAVRLPSISPLSIGFALLTTPNPLADNHRERPMATLHASRAPETPRSSLRREPLAPPARRLPSRPRPPAVLRPLRPRPTRQGRAKPRPQQNSRPKRRPLMAWPSARQSAAAAAVRRLELSPPLPRPHQQNRLQPPPLQTRLRLRNCPTSAANSTPRAPKSRASSLSSKRSRLTTPPSGAEVPAREVVRLCPRARRRRAPVSRVRRWWTSRGRRACPFRSSPGSRSECLSSLGQSSHSYRGRAPGAC